MRKLIRLSDAEMRNFNRESSKGNQLKFSLDGIWYKTDYMGYEGLSEYVISKLLAFSDLHPDEYVD